MTRLPHPLVSAPGLARRLREGEPLTLLDVRWDLGAESQRADYDAGHLPGATWVEFEEALTDAPGDGGRHPLPARTIFESAMRAAGVRNDVPVIVYDAKTSLAASRAWWLLRYFGKPDVQVLDGGLAAWVAAGGDLTTVIPDIRGDFVATTGHLTAVGPEQVEALGEQHLLLDARPADRFRGENEHVDSVAGHIPGAVSMPALSNLDADGRFLPTDDLALRFTARGVPHHQHVGVYCGSGVQAMHLALALEVSGLCIDPAVYVGSWSHWITDSERPIATGA